MTLAITRIEPFERWAWHLATDTPLDVEVRVATAGEERTLATVAVTGSVLAAPGKLARAAVARLYDLCQTGAVP